MHEVPGGDVPPDFPRGELGAVAGAQPKLLLRRTEAGVLSSELSENELAARFAFCDDLCGQLVAYCERKAGENPLREQSDVVRRVARSKQLNDFCSRAEAQWILKRMVAQLGWLLPSDVR
ncbi:hypothetical protein DES41_10668 [Pseudorhodoferax soli]|uniref:Uncharacterized protein n=1 Tax=Pseudorhodoferax soli TaxID=545864 RepID=A0A368XRM0_9BURK|nr:hypothetical protein DES41_10668 [Pseudorhodoferax soli]